MGDEKHWADEFWAIVDVLKEDARKCVGVHELTEPDDLEGKIFWRRMLARSTFALIDSVTYRLMITGYAGHIGRGKSSPEEAEKFYDFRGECEVKPTFGRSTFAEALEYAFIAFAKGFDSHYRLPKEEAQWESINELELLRDRLDYPDSLADLDLTDADVDVIVNSAKWLTARWEELMDSCPLDAVLRFRGGKGNDPSTS